ncbi:6-phosphofructokinase beta subunit [Nadsonia fulvescens var. elongata DSM 6958]|uniref:ATP-dependent 6-phosphofructokinase n=1 Tax=Nadsonia fulvescens var. elongata DSM 6958 TaxID=857566 RepID=A0A1E3PT87_9ASCO|nr:6-phosphofructokinase beta subunit [Nadsonia fulvescens var. elongata DSM 6958]
MSFAPTPLISGLSSVSSKTSDKNLFELAVKFYAALGFSTTASQTKKEDASDVIQQVRLVSFTGTGDTASAGSSASKRSNSGFSLPESVLNILLTKTGLTAKQVQETKEFLHSQDEADWRGLAPSMVFVTPDICAVKTILEELRGSFAEEDSKVTKNYIQLYPSDLNPIELYCLDPLGNVIGFTTKTNPMSLAIPKNDKTSTWTPSRSDSNWDSVTESTCSEFNPYSNSAIPSSQGGKASPITPTDISMLERKRIAVLTSGGDSQGMNAVVRAVIRTTISRGCEPYVIYEGYEGLLKGGDYIKRMYWDDVRGWLALGGTLIGTARCAEFKERAGRLRAAKNLVQAGIDAIIVCGGDGSLTGADVFRAEWPELLKELVNSKQIQPKDAENYKNLNICGVVGSIDNDMSSTDATIGAYSSLDRICEAVDYIDATAQSHSRAFVIEVMGRNCGWLALMAAIATGADYLFIPEKAPNAKEFGDKMCKIVARHRENGKRKTIVIVSEGAIDSDLKPVTANMVKDILVERLGLDTRVTTLGHVQRGGPAVAFDRLLATLQGVEAVDAILSLTPETASPLIALNENKICRKPLVDSVKMTKSVAEAINNKEFAKAMSLRDPEFIENLESFYAITSADKSSRFPSDKSLKIAMICIGAPAGGMNAAIRAATSYCFARGHIPYAINNGWTGLARHESVRKLSWVETEEWTIKGGCEIGTNRNLPDTDYGMIAYYFQKYKFDGLIIIGGFEAFISLNQLEQARRNYPAFCIPMVCLPATISNNVPGTEYSLGSDTCLNSLVDYCDVIKQSAASTRSRVFVVEVQGGNSGYVATYAGLVTGSQAVYTPESGISLPALESDIEFLKRLFHNDEGLNHAGKLILRNEKSSSTLTTEVIADIIREEAKGKFDTRTAIPGHVQQGGTPSPIDRVRATRAAVRSIQFIEKNQHIRELPFHKQAGAFVVNGVKGAKLSFSPIRHLHDFETEFVERRPKNVHWAKLGLISDMLVGRPKVY